MTTSEQPAKTMFILVVFFLASMCTVSADEVCRVSGTVVDQAGGAVPDAVILVYRWHRGAKGAFELEEVGRFRSDSGVFTAAFPAGTYEIFCTHPGLLPAAARIDLAGKAETRITLKLQFDPAHPPSPCCDAVAPTN